MAVLAKENYMIRKNKGDVSFYLEYDRGVFHVIKKKKIYRSAIELKMGKSKTTKQVVSDFYFNKNNFHHIDFSVNGLRDEDKTIIEIMITEIENTDNGTLRQ
jgi:hypothetical protein